MTGTILKFPSKFQFLIDSVPATGRNFSGILNLAAIKFMAKLMLFGEIPQAE
jgi:hypothetical protein